MRKESGKRKRNWPDSRKSKTTKNERGRSKRSRSASKNNRRS